MSMLDGLFTGGLATKLATNDPDVSVDVSAAVPPSAGQALRATGPDAAEWADVASGAATELTTTEAPVDVGSSAPPNTGDVLTALDEEHAEWAAPAPAGRLATPDPDVPVDIDGSGPTDAGQALVSTSLSAARWRPLQQQAYLRRPIIGSMVEDAFNDEFEGGNPDLAARGWVVWNATTNTVMTRAGDVNPCAGTPVTGGANLYNSTFYGSQLYIQFDGFSGIQAIRIYKPVTVATSGANLFLGAMVSARMGGMRGSQNGGGTGQAGGICSVGFGQNDAGHWKSDGSAEQQQAYQNDNPSNGPYHMSFTPFTIRGGSTFRVDPEVRVQADVVALRAYNTGTQGFIADSASGRGMWMSPQDPGSTDWATAAYAGVTMVPFPAAGDVAFSIDYIRIKVGDMSLAANWIA